MALLPKRLIYKFIRMLLLLLAVSIFTFALLSLSPVDPLSTNLGQAALGAMSPEQVQKLEAYWGVHTPPAERFLSWFNGVLHGDFGVSLIYRTEVLTVIGERLRHSFFLIFTAWLLSGCLGFILGIIAGRSHGRWVDKLISFYCLATASAPAFWIGLILLMVFAVRFPLFPIGLSGPIGIESQFVTLSQRLHHGILPVIALTITGVSHIALHTREKTIEILNSDYVLFAHARGETPAEIFKNHLLRNALLPAISLQFANIGELIGGAALIEQVFSYPGIAQAAVSAGLGGDVPLLLGITLITSLTVFLGNFTADLLYASVDPRIGREQSP